MPTHVIEIFSFAEIVPDRESSARLIDNSLFIAVDLVVVGTGKDRNDSAKVLRDISEDVFLKSNYQIVSLPGTGNGKLKALNRDNASKLIMVLPGRVAGDFRVKFVSIWERFLAGDRSFIQDIHGNAPASSPHALMARASLASAGSSAAPVLKSIAGPSAGASAMAGAPINKSIVGPSAGASAMAGAPINKSIVGPSAGAPSAPAMGAVFQSIPPSVGPSRDWLAPLPPISEDCAMERVQLSQCRGHYLRAFNHLVQRENRDRTIAAVNTKRMAELNAIAATNDKRTAYLNARVAKKDRAEEDLLKRKRQFDVEQAESADQMEENVKNQDARGLEQNVRAQGLDVRTMDLHRKELELEARAAELVARKASAAELDARGVLSDARDAQFERRSTELREKEEELSNINAGMLIRGLEQDNVKLQQDARQQDLEERETELERGEDDSDKRRAEQVKRSAELDKREAQIPSRQAVIMHAMGVESDKNHAALELKKAEVEAITAENVKVKAGLDARAAELDKLQAGAPLDVVVAEEVQPCRKRARSVDFSQVTQMGEELEKILAMNLDDETKQELKQRLYSMHRAD